MIYLDNAATTFPKPRETVAAACDCMEHWCGNPGRGAHELSKKSASALYDCREAAAELFGLDNCEGVVFTLNATHALNAAVFGLLHDGDHVLISDLEHNSVLRPVEYLRSTGKIEYDVFPSSGNVTSNISRLVRKNTKAVICLHASNIVNRVLPIFEIGRLCKRLGILFILDASQSAGSIDINMRRDNISVLCTAGHKGLLGPAGIGLALFSDGVMPRAFMHGGSGVNSKDAFMPEFLPDRLEAGTMPVPAVAGLLAGIGYVRRRGIKNIREWECGLSDILHRKFLHDGRFEVYSRQGGSLFLFNVKGQSAQSIGDALNKAGICTRAGLHCAPLAHKTVGTPEGGAVRVGIGPFNTEEDILTLCAVLDGIGDGKNF